MISETDGAWTGKMGQVSRNEVDMIISDCLISYTRSQVVQSTFFYDKDFLGWVSPSPAPQAKYLSLIAPFQPLTWLLMVLSIFFLALMLCIVANFESKLRSIELNEWSNLNNALWYSFGIFLSEICTKDNKSAVAPAIRQVTRFSN